MSSPILCPRCLKPNPEPRLVACIPCLVAADPLVLELFVASRDRLYDWLEPRVAWLEAAERDERWRRAKARVDERLATYMELCKRLLESSPEVVVA